MHKKLKNYLYEGSFSLSVLAFLLLGFQLGMLNEEDNQGPIIVTAFFIVLLFTLRIYVLILQGDKKVLFKQFYQWLFEASVVFFFAAFQQNKVGWMASLLMLAVIILLVLFLIVFSKLIN